MSRRGFPIARGGLVVVYIVFMLSFFAFLNPCFRSAFYNVIYSTFVYSVSYSS